MATLKWDSSVHITKPLVLVSGIHAPSKYTMVMGRDDVEIEMYWHDYFPVNLMPDYECAITFNGIGLVAAIVGMDAGYSNGCAYGTLKLVVSQFAFQSAWLQSACRKPYYTPDEEHLREVQNQIPYDHFSLAKGHYVRMVHDKDDKHTTRTEIEIDYNSGKKGYRLWSRIRYMFRLWWRVDKRPVIEASSKPFIKRRWFSFLSRNRGAQQ